MNRRRTKTVKIFDPTLMSGSVDTFRTTVGAGLTTVTDRYGTKIMRETKRSMNKKARNDKQQELKNDPDFQPSKDPDSNELIRHIASLSSNDVTTLDKIQYDSDSAVPIIRYAGRIYGDAELIENDMQWEAFINGGTYMDTEYDGMFVDAEYYDHWFEYNMPYTSLELERIKRRQKSLPAMNEINVSYEYNRYMKKYERYAKSLPSEKIIPNLYMLQAFSEADDVSKKNLDKVYDTFDRKFVSREDKLKKSVWSDLLKDETDFENEENYKIKQKRRFNKKRRRRMRQYLNRDVVRNPLKAETELVISNKLSNIIFDNEAMSGIFQNAAANKNLFPYYAKISFEANESKQFSDRFNEFDYTAKFLVALKEVFGNNPSYFTPEENEFVAQITDRRKGRRKNRNKVGTINARLADFGIILNESRKNYINTKSDFCFIGKKNLESRLSAYDQVGNYRFFNTKASTSALIEYLDFADENKYLNVIKEPFEDEDFDGKYNETIAYRIEKIGGPPSGDSNTQNVLQNFWFANSRDLYERTDDSAKEKDFNFFDTQVKYGEEYTYNVYAYVIVAGSRYELSDHIITKVIAKLDEGEEGSKKNLYCLEFYDPNTGEIRNKLYNGEGSGDVAVDNDFMTNSQIGNINKYLADFNVTVQPSIKVVEIPLTSKTIQLLDAPPNTAQAMPFPVEDDTSRIGYDIEYTATDDKAFPPAISEADSNYRESYMFSNNLLPKTNIDKGSVSYPRFLQIFRTDEPPRSYEDFDGKLRKTVDLKIENSEHTLKEYVFYDKIDTNKNFYYIFRFVNEHGNPGRPSVVHVASLQDDGGYKYPKFDIYDFAAAQEKRKSEKTRDAFKKLLEIRPSYQNLVFNGDSYNADMNSDEVLNKLKVGVADSPIWNKTFKLRLTSKKTGKKIDLNIKYRLMKETGRNKLEEVE
jgi:hypothetical protein